MERYVWIPPSAAGEYCPLEVMYKPDDVAREIFWQRILDCQEVEWEVIEGLGYVALTDREALRLGEMNYKASKLLRGLSDVHDVQSYGYYGIVVVAKMRLDDGGEPFIGWLDEADVQRLKSGYMGKGPRR